MGIAEFWKGRNTCHEPQICPTMKTMHFTLILLYSLFSLACSNQQDPIIPPGEEQENPQPNPDPDSGTDKARVLVFTKTEGFRHTSISAGIELLEDLATEMDFLLDKTEAATEFTNDGLARYDLVIFLSTTGNILNASQEQAFEGFMRNGGSFMGIHAAADTEYAWAWYGNMLGAYFESHPEVQQALIEVTQPSHPATQHLTTEWIHRDEWYNFRDVKVNAQEVLLQLDEDSYQGGTMGAFHPIAWTREFEGGKVFYTGLGHTTEAYSNENFRKHIAGGITYCLSD